MLGKGCEAAAMQALQAFPRGMQIGGNAFFFILISHHRTVILSVLIYNRWDK